MSNKIYGPQTAEGPIRIRPKLSSQAEREVRRDSRLRRARTCYGHLVGVAGVALMDKMISLGWLEELAAAGKSTGGFAFGCLDWTERRQHLGGALGRAVTAYLSERGFVVGTLGTRAVTLNSSPEVWLDGAGPQR